MDQVKIFSGVVGDGGLEKKINEWFTENAGTVEITRVLQSSSSSGGSSNMSAILHLTIFYRKK